MTSWLATAMADQGFRRGRTEPLIPDDRHMGPSVWVFALMIFLALLAVAAALSFGQLAWSVNAAARDGLTIQIVDADIAARDAASGRVAAQLAADPRVTDVRQVAQNRLDAELTGWIGSVDRANLPVPALIDARLSDAGQRPGQLRALARDLARVAPNVRIEPHARWLGGAVRLASTLAGLALALGLAIVAASAAIIALATRSALDAHRATVEVLHIIGATDRQLAALFQRRVTRDALIACALGSTAAMAVLMAIDWQMEAMPSLAGTTTGTFMPLSVTAFALVAGAAVLLARRVARTTVLHTVRGMG